MKKILPVALIIAVLISCIAFLPSVIGAEEKREVAAGSADPVTPSASAIAFRPGELYLHIGSPIALSDGEILPLDSENPGLTPVIHLGRTLVPLRFVSEFFSAEVSYDAQTRTGVVKANGKTAEFPVGRSYFVLDGIRTELDTETLNIDGRVMLPLRALCEEALGLSVDYLNSVILIADSASLGEDRVNEVKSKIGMYIKVPDLETLTHYFAEAAGNKYLHESPVLDDGMMLRGADAQSVPEGEASLSSPAPSAAPEMPVASNADRPAEADSGGAGGGHSSTNTQVEGIDEGDIIKTDGKYIYLSCYNTIKIIKADGGMSLAAQIDVPGYYLTDMYIDDGLLVAVGNESAVTGRTFEEGGKTSAQWAEYVVINVYDTSDMSDIKLLRDYKIEGYLTTSRKQDGYLYLLSSRYTWDYGTGIDPRPLAGENGRLAPLPVGDIMIAPGCPADALMTLSAISLRDAGENVTSETITVSGYAMTQYMSNNALYIASQDYLRGGMNGLSIAKFSIDGGRIGYAGSGAVRGGMNNQFSMDEHQGHLRVATTEWDTLNKNNLFVLDGNMQICGSVEGFAPDERIYSARFMGDRGYIVTFRETDPLFVFDLKDPANPKITGELKVPGFSSYLHPVSENVILGVGNDVYDIYMRDRAGNEVVVGQRTGGIKLSLFDVSDMGKPREIDTLILGDGGYSELLYNHKAAMFKSGDSILAFCAEIADGVQNSEWYSGAFVVSYAGDKLSECGRIRAADNSGVSYGYAFNGQRLVYIGNTLYYAQNNVIRSFDLNTLAEKQMLKLG